MSASAAAKPVSPILRPGRMGSGLALAWLMSEGGGTVLNDASGQGRNGTIAAATWVNGQSGRCLQYTATTAFSATGLSIPFNGQMGLGASFWAKGLPTSADAVLFGVKNASGYVLDVYMQFNNNYTVGGTGGDSASAGPSNGMSGGWEHYYVQTRGDQSTFNNDIEVWRNGVIVSSKYASFNYMGDSPITQVIVGSNGTDTLSMNGFLLYTNRWMSGMEVRELYADSWRMFRPKNRLFRSVITSSFSSDITTVPQSHATAITLTLTGVGTTWTSGSSVTVNNSVTGTTTVTKGTWTRTSNTAATLTISTAAGTGTFTITIDGVTSSPLTVNSYAATASLVSSGPAPVINLSGSASGGSGTYTYQWYRDTTSGFTPGGGNILSGKTSTTCSDTTASTSTVYYYVLAATDTGNNSIVMYSPQVVAQVYTGGAIGSSGGVSRGRVVNGGDMRQLKQSTAYNLLVLMTDSADHVSGKTGLTLTITASKAGAAFASITPTVTERVNGWYQLALTTSHTDTLGDLVLHVTGTGADPSDPAMQVTANILGDTLPANVTEFLGEAVTLEDGTVQTSGSNSTTVVILASGSSSSNSYYNGRSLTFVDGTNAGQSTIITAYNGTTKAATVSPALAAACDNTSQYVFGEPVGDVSSGGGLTAAAVWDYLTSSATTSGSLGKLLVDNVNAAITSRQATFTASTNVTLPSTVASPTNITAGTITTVTTLTNLPTAPTDWLTAAAVKADAVTKVQTGLATAATLGSLVTTVGAAGAGLTSVPYTGPSAGTIQSGLATASGQSALATLIGTPAQDGSAPSWYTAPSSSVVLASNGLDAVVVESGINARQALALIGAATAGKSSGYATGSPVFLGMGNTTPRVSATVADTGRTSVSLTPPA